MSTDHTRLDAIRDARSELENHYIDELRGRPHQPAPVHAPRRRDRDVDRPDGRDPGRLRWGQQRELLGIVELDRVGSSAAAAPTKGGTLKLASAGSGQRAINPLMVDDAGGLCLLAQTGEFLAFDNNQLLQLQPMLATRWTPTDGGTVWTFKLRPGVKFHDGSPMTADDVVYTFQQLADPKNASNALSTFTGVLKPDGRGQGRLRDGRVPPRGAPTATSPTRLLRQLQRDHRPQGHRLRQVGQDVHRHRPVQAPSYSQNVSANFVANPDYWGGAPNLDLDRVHLLRLPAAPDSGVAGRPGRRDRPVRRPGRPVAAQQASYSIIKLKSANHRELSMRNDQAPFTDARVRQAIALSLNRPAHGPGAAER